MRILLCLAIVLRCASPLWSQSLARQELAIGASSSRDRPFGGVPEYPTAPSYYTIQFLSPELRYDLNLNRNLALETEVASSVNHGNTSVREGGYQTLALGGLKAGIRRGRFGLFGTWEAGVASYSRGSVFYTMYSALGYARVTHFALQQGAAVEFAASRRTFLRLDADELLDAQFQRNYFFSQSFRDDSFSTIPYHFATTLSVGRRFGKLQDLPAPPDDRQTHGYSVGGFYGMGLQEHLLENQVHAFGGGGAWLGFPVWKLFSGDVIAFDQPRDDHTADAQDGGTTFSAFAGPKAGLRRGSFGFYAKARPGIHRFSRTNFLDTITAQGGFGFHDRPSIQFALDTGLVLEYQPPARTVGHVLLRFEGGSTYDHYHGATITVADGRPGTANPVTTYFYPPERHSSLLFLFGAGYSF